MKRSGFTLVEVVLSLALLSALAVAVARFAEGLRSTEAATRRDEWSSCAQRALERVRLDLRIAETPRDPERVRIIDAGWEVLGRHGSWIPYRFTAASGELRRGDDPVPLLGSLETAAIEVDLEAGRVVVTLTAKAGGAESLEVDL